MNSELYTGASARFIVRALGKVRAAFVIMEKLIETSVLLSASLYGHAFLLPFRWRPPRAIPQKFNNWRNHRKNDHNPNNQINIIADILHRGAKQ
jgi:hypothetical protein